MAEYDDSDVSEDQEPQPAQPKTYTKAELDGILAKELAKEQLRLRKQYANYPELQTKAQELDRLREESKSDIDRARDEAAKAAKERDHWREMATDRMIRNAIMAEAARQGATDPEDVARLLDTRELVITDDGVDGVKEAVEVLLANKRYLVGGRRRAGLELRGAEQSSNARLTQSQISAWMAGRDGGMNPEREKQIEEAYKAGAIDRRR